MNTEIYPKYGIIFLVKTQFMNIIINLTKKLNFFLHIKTWFSFSFLFVRQKWNEIVQIMLFWIWKVLVCGQQLVIIRIQQNRVLGNIFFNVFSHKSLVNCWKNLSLRIFSVCLSYMFYVKLLANLHIEPLIGYDWIMMSHILLGLVWHQLRFQEKSFLGAEESENSKTLHIH